MLYNNINYFKLKEVYENEESFYADLKSQITTLLGNEPPTEMVTYIFKPVWRRFKNATAKFEYSDEGVESFKDNLYNQVEEISFDFFTWVATNLEYFKTFINPNAKNTAFSKQLMTQVAPINQDINQTATATVFANGTTAQSIIETINSGIGWYGTIKNYLTPQRKNDMLDSFKWLFISINTKVQEHKELVIDSLERRLTSGYATAKVNPTNITEANIVEGVEILGVTGTAELKKPEQEKSVTYTANGGYSVTPDAGKVLTNVDVAVDVPIQPTKEVSITANGTTNITPDAGAAGIASVSVTTNVAGPATQEKTVTYTANGNYQVEADAGKLMNKVNVEVDVASSGGDIDVLLAGGVSMDIDYGGGVNKTKMEIVNELSNYFLNLQTNGCEFFILNSSTLTFEPIILTIENVSNLFFVNFFPTTGPLQSVSISFMVGTSLANYGLPLYKIRIPYSIYSTNNIQTILNINTITNLVSQTTNTQSINFIGNVTKLSSLDLQNIIEVGVIFWFRILD